MRVSITLILLSMAIPIAAMAQQDTDASTPPQDIGVTNTNEKIYTWVDEDGVEHFVDSPTEVPPGIDVNEYDLDQVDRLSVGGDGLRESEKRYLSRQVQESIAEEKAEAEAEPDTVVVDAESRPEPMVVDDDGFAPADPDLDPELVDRDGVAIGPAGDNIDDLQDTGTSGTFPDDIGTSDDLEPNVDTGTNVGISTAIDSDIDGGGVDAGGAADAGGADTGGVTTGGSLGTSAGGS